MPSATRVPAISMISARVSFRSIMFHPPSLSTRASTYAQALERCARGSAADIRRNCQLKYGDVREFDTVFLDLSRGRRCAEIPLLTHNLSKRPARIRQRSQHKLLRTRYLLLLKNQRDALELLRLIKNQPNRLSSRLSGTPALPWLDR